MIPLIAAIALAHSVNAQSASVAPAATSTYSYGPTTASPVWNTPGQGSQDYPGYLPLNRKTFTYDNLPYRVDDAAWGRGPQAGYNLCNATTTGDTSMCQTLVMNSFMDMCLWGLKEPSNVGDSEASAVAFCLDATAHGSRAIPDNTITGMTWLRTPEYIQITGRMDQTKLNVEAGDYGGELDPVGADYRGNPLGGLIFTNAFTQNGTYQQVVHWNNFLGGDAFCFRICLPGSNNATRNCEHIYDRIGCQYNAPGNYEEGVFEQCDGEVARPVGEYINAYGQTTTWTQPAESLGPISTVPYTPSIPPSSNCITQTSLPAAFATAGLSGLISGASGLPTDTAAVTIQTAPPTPTPLATNAQQAAVSGALRTATSISVATITLALLAILTL